MFHIVCNEWIEWTARTWAEPVTLQISAVKNEKVENLNQIFTEVQRDVKSISKSVAPEPKKQTQVEGLNLRSYKIIKCHATFKWSWYK